MKRILLSTALCAAFPIMAQADDILIRANLSEATVFGAGAEVTREGTASLPAGRHRLLIAVPDLDAAQLPQIEDVDGVRFGPPQPLYNHTIEEGVLDTPAQAAARETVEAAEDALAQAQDTLTQADASIRAIETQQRYLEVILRGGESGVAMPEDPTLLPQFLGTLGTETARLADEMLAAQIARRDQAEAVTDAQLAFAEATRALQLLQPFGTQINAMAIDVTVAEAAEAEVALSYFTRNAAWRPSYELDLATDTGALSIDRFVTLQTFGTARWDEVDVTFSTATPDRDRVPTALGPRPARLTDPNQVGGAISGRALEEFSANIVLTDPAIAQTGYGAAADGVVEAAPPVEAEFNGLAVSYPYPTPVTVAATGEVLLTFDRLEMDVEMENRAVPRWDETAFLIAMTDNETGEPILPGLARFYRDGALMGEGALPLIAAGAEVEFAFGALDHLRLTWIDRSLEEGDRGVFVSSTTQAREIAFGVENTGSEAAAVRIMYATPFAEQEDLDLDLTLNPRPDAENVDDMRGVSQWNVEVAPGEEQLIEMIVTFAYPEGQVLNWRP